MMQKTVICAIGHRPTLVCWGRMAVCMLVASVVCMGCRNTKPGPPARTGYGDIHDAAGAGNIDAIEEFVRSGVCVDVLDNHGESAVHHAVKYGRQESVLALVNEGADVSIPTALGRDTPVHYAVMRQDWGMVELLLRLGAQGDRKNAEGVTPREYAANQGVLAEYELAASKARQGAIGAQR